MLIAVANKTSGMILDSGGVLIRPTSRRWFPFDGFEEAAAGQGLQWEAAAFEAALGVGVQLLDYEHRTPMTRVDAEVDLWIRYHEIVATELGCDAPAEVARETVTRWRTRTPVEPFEWTVPVLSSLRARGITVVVLSDAWPSLRDWYVDLGLDAYVHAMVISAEEAMSKPDERVFAKARALLGDVDQAFFVDDWPGNVEAANALGLTGIRLRPQGSTSHPGLVEIDDLRDLLDLMDRTRA